MQVDFLSSICSPAPCSCQWGNERDSFSSIHCWSLHSFLFIRRWTIWGCKVWRCTIKHDIKNQFWYYISSLNQQMVTYFGSSRMKVYEASLHSLAWDRQLLLLQLHFLSRSRSQTWRCYSWRFMWGSITYHQPINDAVCSSECCRECVLYEQWTASFLNMISHALDQVNKWKEVIKSRNCRSEGGHSFTVHCSDCSIYKSSQVGKHLVHGGERLVKKREL